VKRGESVPENEFGEQIGAEARRGQKSMGNPGMVIFLRAGSELRLKLNPDVDYYTRRVETEEGKTLRQILMDIRLDPAFVAFAYSEGRIFSLDAVPRDGQSITLQPPVSGG